MGGGGQEMPESPYMRFAVQLIILGNGDTCGLELLSKLHDSAFVSQAHVGH